MGSFRAIVVDDDAFTRLLLGKAIEGLGHSVEGAFATAREAVEFAEQVRPQLAVLDLDLGAGPTGIDVAQHLRRADRSIGIVLLTSYEDPRLIRSKNLALPSGSVYLAKKEVDSDSVIAMAIDTAMSYSLWGDVHASATTGTTIAARASLSDSQIEVMRLVARGLTNAEIAKERFVTEAAVGKAVARLVRQLGIVATPQQNQRVLIARAYFEAIGRSSRNEG